MYGVRQGFSFDDSDRCQNLLWALEQMCGPGLACTHTAVEAGASCRLGGCAGSRPTLFTVVLARVTLMRVGGREGLRQLESVNTKTCAAFDSESTAAVLAVGSLATVICCRALCRGP